MLKLKNFFVLLPILFLIVAPTFVFGATDDQWFGTANDAVPSGGQNQGTPSGGSNQGVPPGGQNQTNATTLANPLNVGSFCGLLKAIFAIAIQIGIPIAVVFVVYAGFKFVLARGNPEGLKKAKANLMFTLVGIALFFGAWFLAQIITNTLVELGGSDFNTCV
jgi:hypothetical protein